MNDFQNLLYKQSLTHGLKIGLQTNLTVTNNYTGGIEQSYAEFSKIFDKVFHANTLTFTGHNHHYFQKIAVEENAYAGKVIFFPNPFQVVKGIKESFERNAIDIVLWADAWGFNDDTSEGLALFRKLLELIESHPIVWSIMSNNMLTPPYFPWAKHPDLYSRFLNGVRAFIAVSANIKAELINVGVNKNKIFQIAPPVDLSVFKPVRSEVKKAELRKELGIPKDKFVILYSGRFSTGKGTNWLMNTWKELKSSIKDADLHLVMVGETYTEYSQSEEWQLKKNTFITENKTSVTLSEGFVLDQRLLAKWYQAADVFVFPSILPEGLPVALLKAVACGLPVIVTEYSLKHTGVAEIFTNNLNGVIFNDYASEKEIREIPNPNSFRRALSQIACDYKMYKQGAINFLNSRELQVDIGVVAEEHYKILLKAADK